MKRFIAEQIQVELPGGNFLEKKPQCPEKILWGDNWITIIELISAWNDFARKGKSARNMSDEHLARAAKKGSWGVGRYYYKVLGDDDCIYTIYYDRAPENIRNRKGKWILLTREEF